MAKSVTPGIYEAEVTRIEHHSAGKSIIIVQVRIPRSRIDNQVCDYRTASFIGPVGLYERGLELRVRVDEKGEVNPVR
jgi:hypothetical protein